MRVVFIIIVAIMFVKPLLGSHEVTVGEISGSQVISGGSVITSDNKFSYMLSNPGWSSEFSNLSVINRVYMEVDHNYPQYISSSYGYSVLLRLYKTNASNITTTEDITLEIRYDNSGATYTDKSSYEFSGAYKLKAEILSVRNLGTNTLVTDPADNLKLGVSTDVDRCYSGITGSVVSGINRSYNATQNELTITWDFIPGAESYDLEWTLVSDEDGDGNPSTGISATNLKYDFRNNATRVSVSDNYYTLPVIFERGYIVYRVRATGRICGNPEYQATGEWSMGDNHNQSVCVADVATGNRYQVSASHEAGLNWQYNSTYAEDGLRKDVVAYADGSLRSRQTATRLNTSGKIVIGENIYDYQGRPAIQILPTPVESQKIAYYSGLNRNTLENKYSVSDFDLDAAHACLSNTSGAMSTSRGASKYYSSNTPDADLYQRYLPDANGYPFVQTEYMPDNTGRIRRQGGVGKEMQLGQSHETSYYYGQPAQYELDRLFGSEAGYYSHYKKNMVSDPNGQVSVSYLDMHGRVVATALAGLSPTQLDTIGGYNKNAYTAQWKLIENKGAQSEGMLKTESWFLVPETREYTIDYLAQGSSFTDECLSNICLDCVYDYTLEIRDECGNVKTSRSQRIGDMPGSGNPSSLSCASPLAGYTWQGQVTLDKGYYQLVKILKVNEESLERYAALYIANANSTCVRDRNSFIAEQQTQNSNTDCDYTCEECLASLGTRPTDPAEAAEWDAQKAECEELCPHTPNYCETVFLTMKSDVSPFGQYGQYEEGDNAPSQYPLSVFNTANVLPGVSSGVNAWNELTGYKESNGSLSKIYIVNGEPVYTGQLMSDAQGSYVYPQQLSNISDFISYWRESWAATLVVLHPEYAYMTWCDGMEGTPRNYTCNTTTQANLNSDEYDALLKSIDTYDAAVCYGIIPGSGSYATWSSAQSLSIVNADPYFVSGSGSAYISRMNSLLYNNGAFAQSLYGLSASAGNCGTNYYVNTIPLACYDFGANTSTRDAEWNRFKLLYISKKQEIQAIDRTIWAVSNYHSNYCIGSDLDALPATLGGNIFLGIPAFLANNQPCNLAYGHLYANKQKRFSDINDFFNGQGDISLSGNYYDDPQGYASQLEALTNNHIYSQTGLCPLAFQLQNMLDGLAANGAYTTTTNLMSGNYLAQDLYDELVSKASLTASTNYTVVWNPQVAGLTLTGNILLNGNSNACSTSPGTVVLSLPSGAGYGFNAIHKVMQVYNVANAGGGRYTFSASVLADTDGSPLTPDEQIVISGNTCLSISDCSTGLSATNCIPADVTKDIVNVVNAEFSVGTFAGDHAFTSTLLPMITQSMKDQTNSALTYWDYNYLSSPATHALEIMPNTGSNTKIKVQIPATGILSTLDFNNYGYAIVGTSTIPGGNANQIGLTFKRFDKQTGNPYDLLSVTATIDVYQSGNLQNFSTVDCGSNATCNSPAQKTADALEYFFANLGTNVDASAYALDNEYTVGDRLLNDMNLTSSQSLVWASTVSGNSLSAVFEKNSASLANVYLEFASASPGFGFSAITGMNNLYVDQSQSTAGQYYHFTLWATNGSTWEMLNGHSDFSIAHCENCEGSDKRYYTEDFEDAQNYWASDYSSGQVCSSTGVYQLTTDASSLCSPLQALDRQNPGSGTFYIASVKGKQALCYSSAAWKLQNLSVYPQTEYEISFWVKRAIDNDNIPTVSVSANSVEMIDEQPINALGAWQKVRFIWYSGSSSQLNLNLYFCSGDAEAPAYMALDDISIYQRGCTPVNYEVNPTPTITMTNPCDNSLSTYTDNIAGAAYESYINNLKADFIARMRTHCLDAATESLTLEYQDREYQYTLYYYDQAGNLRRTAPPAGVTRVTDGNQLAQIEDDRANNASVGQRLQVKQNMCSYYKYNSFNQPYEQTTPDGGKTLFWYDRLGRLVLSQNSKQLNEMYSYTMYDALGRIVQVGQCENTSPPDESLCRNESQLSAWFASAAYFTQTTRTYYDYAAFSGMPSSFSQKNLRGRVASVSIDHDGDGNYESATHYCYDVHGNVSSLLQDIPALNAFSSRYKQTDYTYDLVSGKVLQVAYQDGQCDRFYHRYKYDADNRITHVYTSDNKRDWDEDAAYYYYDHGPLARVELGDEKVQGIDYAYTLHGWLKGINSTILSSANDMGKDGKRDDVTTGSYDASVPNIHGNIPPDVASFVLNYYYDNKNNYIDYTSISHPTTANGWEAADAYNTDQNLWNGNIQAMSTSIYTGTGFTTKSPMLYQYRYDQLQRVKQSQSYMKDGLATTNSWSGKATGGYDNGYSYDANGNIQTLNATQSSSNMDNLSYHYYDKTNKLEYVEDATSTPTLNSDIENQSNGNYQYDAIGNLIYDQSESIDNIEWTVYGKIRGIDFGSGSGKRDLRFLYDAMGNRIAKVEDEGYGFTDYAKCNITWYIRDAQGNVMETYSQTTNGATAQLYLNEYHLYGSSRLGVKNVEKLFATSVESSYFSRVIGMKQYEIANHLGNVLTTVTDNKLAVNSGGMVSGYLAQISSSSDYYPFGSLQPGRNFNAGDYRFGFNGQEMDNEVTGGVGNTNTAMFWEYDTRLGRRWNMDPVMKPWESPYLCFSGNPIINADPNGDDDDVVITGPEADEATKQADNASSLNITRDSQTGKLDATGTPTTESDVLLLKAIKDPTVTSEIYASQSQKTTSNAMFAGGAFMGTTVTTTNFPTPAGLNGGTIDIPVNTAVSKQEVNVSDCRKIDNYYGKTVGTTMIHEITESYVAGTISKTSGVDSPPAGVPGSVYEPAHYGAAPEAGGVRKITDAKTQGFPYNNYIYLGSGPDEDRPDQKIKVDVILRAY